MSLTLLGATAILDDQVPRPSADALITPVMVLCLIARPSADVLTSPIATPYRPVFLDNIQAAYYRLRIAIQSHLRHLRDHHRPNYEMPSTQELAEVMADVQPAMKARGSRILQSRLISELLALRLCPRRHDQRQI